jgi:hypothetical protein
MEAVEKKRSDLKKDIKEHPGWSDAERRMTTKSEMDKLPRINALLRSLLDNSTSQNNGVSTPSTRSRANSVLSDDARSRDDDSFVHLEKSSPQ